MDFQAGDTVKLKSGGELMTVESVDDGLVECVWFNAKKVERHSFEPATLEKAKKASVAVASSRSF